MSGAPAREGRDGHLLIVGGHEDREDDKLILGRFVELCGGPQARIFVLTAASTVHDEMWQIYLDAFKALGVEHLSTADIASRADAADESVAERIHQADGMFMTGGDQKRLLALIGGTRVDQAMHRALRERGACIGGTSAGASAMSEHMLFDGSRDILPQKGSVHLGAGLGFLGRIIVDQHFSERQRLGRLLAVVAQNPYLLGAGIDENTALIVRPGKRHRGHRRGRGDAHRRARDAVELHRGAQPRNARARQRPAAPASGRRALRPRARRRRCRRRRRKAASGAARRARRGDGAGGYARAARRRSGGSLVKVVERRVLRGPNIHSPRPCFMAVVDLESLDEVSSTAIDGFVDRLLAAVPTLHEHRCSLRRVGGFVERLRAGTYMAHIVEHVTIELQCLAGQEVGFGKARMVRGRPRHYRIVVAYKAESVVRAALDLALQLVAALAEGAPFALDEGLAALRETAQRAAIGAEHARHRRGGAAARHSALAPDRASQPVPARLGRPAASACRRRRRARRTTSRSASPATSSLTKALLKEAGLPVPAGRTRRARSKKRWRRLRARQAGPVAIKPLDGNQGKGVTTSVLGDEAVGAAFARARRPSAASVIVEDHIAGDDYRVLVIGANVVAAARRRSARGHRRRPVERAPSWSRRKRRSAPRRRPRERPDQDPRSTRPPPRSWRSRAWISTPCRAAGRVVRLRGNANLSTGGTAEDVTDRLHPETACGLRARGAQDRPRRGRHRPRLPRHRAAARRAGRRHHRGQRRAGHPHARASRASASATRDAGAPSSNRCSRTAATGASRSSPSPAPTARPPPRCRSPTCCSGSAASPAWRPPKAWPSTGAAS